MLLDNISNSLDFLKDHPWVGASSAFGSWSLLSLNFFTSPDILNYVGIFAAWCGALIAGLTLILKMIEAVEKIQQRLRRTKL